MNNKYDVIIIGAGLGGLTSAVLLSKYKKKVLLLEKNHVPGGYATNFGRKKFEFDAGLHLMFGCQKNGNTYNILKDCGIHNKIKFIKPQFLYRTIFPQIDVRVRQNNIPQYINSLARIFPVEKKGIQNLLRETRKLYRGIYEFDRFKKLSTSYIYAINHSCNELIDSYIKSSKLKALLFQQWPYFGLTHEKLPIFYYAYPWYDYFCNGGYYPKGGAQTISNALNEKFLKNGGKILLNSTVTKIMLNRNKEAEGVVLNSGSRFYAKNIVSNIDARNTFFTLIGKSYLPKDYIKYINHLEPSISAFQVYLGLSDRFDSTIYSDYEIFVNSYFDLKKQYSDSISNKVKKAPFSITIYSTIDKLHTPAKKSVIVLTMFSGYDFWKNLPKHRYKSVKEYFSRILVKRAEKVLPNLSKFIEIKEIATPLTMERYSGCYKGAIYGWAPLGSQSGFRRMDAKTPIRNLFLVGAWTRPGGGTTGVMYSGKSLFHQIIKKTSVK